MGDNKFNYQVVFADGQHVYDDLAKTYAVHKHGLFLLVPSGSGKTYFVEHQTSRDWVDGDTLWGATNALPNGPWWEEPLALREELEARADIITMEARRLGFWVIGGSNTWLKPDGVVILPLSTHKSRLTQRSGSSYDGGFSPEDTQKILTQRTWFSRWTKQGVPEFTSIEEAVTKLTRRAEAQK